MSIAGFPLKRVNRFAKIAKKMFPKILHLFAFCLYEIDIIQLLMLSSQSREFQKKFCAINCCSDNNYGFMRNFFFSWYFENNFLEISHRFLFFSRTFFFAETLTYTLNFWCGLQWSAVLWPKATWVLVESGHGKLTV